MSDYYLFMEVLDACPGLIPALHPEAPGQAQVPMTLKVIKQFRK